MSGWLPLAFAVGIAGGAALTWILTRGNGADTSRRAYGIKVAVVTFVASVAVTLAAVYGVVKWKFRSRPVQKASVEDAVKDFRQKKVASSSSKQPVVATFNVPGAGVYTYKATGYYQVDAPIVGKDRRELPATVPGMLAADGNCWALTIRFFKRHTWKARYCKADENKQSMETTTTANEFFGRKVGGFYGCTPAALVKAEMKPDHSWTQLCKSKKKKHKDRKGTPVKVTFVGNETLAIGNAKLQARHIRRTIVMTGRQKGTTVRDLWFDQTSGLLLRLSEKGSSAGMAKFEADWQLTLANATPSK